MNRVAFFLPGAALRAGCLVLVIGACMTAACASPSVKVQQAAARGQTAELMKALHDADEEWIVEDAALGLGQARHQAALPELLKLLQDPKAGPYRRQAAARALAGLHDDKAIQPLIQALERAEQPEERYWVTASMGRFCTLEAKAALEAQSGSPDLLVARAARKGLADCAREEKP